MKSASPYESIRAAMLEVGCENVVSGSADASGQRVRAPAGQHFGQQIATDV